jgi:hypothetical protein
VVHGSSLGERALQQALSHERLHLYPLNPVGIGPGPWIADLRIEIPVEKGWLVSTQRIPGFPNEKERHRFSIHLGKLRARAALGDHVSVHIAGTLRKTMRRKGSSSKRNAFFEPVVSLRLGLTGTWEEASGAVLWVVSRDVLADDVRAFFDGWRKKNWETAMKNGCGLQSNEYLALTETSALEYHEILRDTVELDLDYMSPDSSD